MGAGEALHGEVAALGAAARENKLGRLRLQPRGDGVARGVDFTASATALGVQAGGIAEMGREQRLHRGAHARVELRGGVVVQVEARHLPLAVQITQSGLL